MSSSQSQQELKRVDGLWFPDASLILRAENSLFRVHGSILAARSSVFQDMISFPQPPRSEGGQSDIDTVDGHGVVVLHDAAAEVEAFLRAIFDSSFFEPPPAAVDYFMVVGILRLAHKYDVPYLFRRALCHLNSRYPTDFPSFLKRREQEDAGLCCLDDDCNCFDLTLHMSAVKAATEVGALWLLPAAYYSVVSRSDFMETALEHLQAHEIRKVLIAQIHFVRATVDVHAFLERLPTPSCRTRRKCRACASEAHEVLHSRRVDQDDSDPVSNWVLFGCESELCESCEVFAIERFDNAQSEFWARLPFSLGLPGWTELKEMRTASMENTL
ncbi:BTB domain-containing protein [Favolaschia claudopus]|uniref:BTB domain-containing protein n=1 Tax=Favolaschia claudopus TaxID=2862362 RepID=A0AAW0EDR2_9AGAR